MIEASPPPPTPVQGVPVIPESPSAHRIRVVPRPAPGQPRAERKRRALRAGDVMAMLSVLVLVAGGASLAYRAHREAAPGPLARVVLAPALVVATLRLDGALVRGATRSWAINREGPLRYGDPVPVSLTAYCLKGTTRRDHYVRQGIVAADPKVFPLGRYVELYVGRTYYGRFLVDDTGKAIHDAILDIWTPTCREARLFGRHRGTAVLVPRPRGGAPDTLLTGRLGGAAAR